MNSMNYSDLSKPMCYLQIDLMAIKHCGDSISVIGSLIVLNSWRA
jgi:hypothetical protein